MTMVRPTTPQDAEAIRRLAAAEPLFNAEETACVEELLGDYLEMPDHNGYFFLTAERDGAVVGFACYGPTPLTQGTFDLYWIAVSQEHARQGIGKALMKQAEMDLRQAQARILVVDTSGRAAYAPTRAFYERLGYHKTATVPDFYGPKDDLVIYTRRFVGTVP